MNLMIPPVEETIRLFVAKGGTSGGGKLTFVTNFIYPISYRQLPYLPFLIDWVSLTRCLKLPLLFSFAVFVISEYRLAGST